MTTDRLQVTRIRPSSGTAARTALLFLLSLLPLLVLPAKGADEADAKGTLAGSWDIYYVDRWAGPVSGRAIVAEDEASVTVRLVDPLSAERYTLRSTAFAREGDSLKVTLEGEAPLREGKETALGQELAIGEGSPYQGRGPATVQLRLGETMQEFSVREPEPAWRQRIELDLAIHPTTLSGTWTQVVNPETGRDQEGQGRLGDFSYLEDGSGRAQQRGYESWSRLRPKVHLVVPYADQYARLLSGAPRFPYPWNEDGSLLTPLADRRYLLVLGEDLPIEIGEAVTLDSGLASINYELEAKPYQLADRPTAQAMVTAAWALIEADLRQQRLALSANGELSAADNAAIKQTLEELRELDFLLLRAELSPGTVPGKTAFQVNGAEGSWSLRFGDLAGDFTFARPLPGGSDDAAISEPADYAFVPDKLYLELRTTKLVPVESLIFQLWLNGKPYLIDGWRNFEAVRLPVTDDDRDHLAYRKTRVEAAGGDPDSVELLYVYRSPPIALVAAGLAAEDAGDVPGVEPGFRIPVQNGDILRGILGTPDEFRVTPAFAQIQVVSSPVEIARYTLGGEVEQNLSWTRALDQARLCANIEAEPPLDLDAIARMTAYTFRNTIVLEAERTSLAMKVGDHAAMLLLREVFLEMMTRQERSLAAITTAADIAAFRAQAAVPVTQVAEHPLATLEVSSPSGETLQFSMTYADDEFLDGRYGLSAAGLAAWRENATREVLAQYLVEVRRSLALARDVATCGDLQALVELSGRGFDGVYRYTLGRLLTTDSSALAPGDYWKPDRQARAWLLGVPTFADALRAQQEFSAADTKAIVTGTMLATAAVGVGGGLLATGITLLSSAEAGGVIGSLAYSAAVLSQVGQALAFSLDVAGIATNIASEFAGKAESLAEIEFARGTALAIGTARLERAIEEDKSYFDIAASLYPDLALGLVGNLDLSETVGILQRFGQSARVSRMTDNLVRGGSRTVAQVESVERGRAMFGAASGETQVLPSPNALTAQSPPVVDPGDIAANFPDANQLEALAGIRADDLLNTANPDALRTLEEIAPDPQAVFGAPGDTIAAGVPTPPAGVAPSVPSAGVAAGVPPAGAAVPGPGDFDGSATQAVGGDRVSTVSRPPANIADFERANREAVEALTRARNEVEAALYAGADISPLQAIRLEADTQTYMAQSLLAAAARDARNAGVEFAEIESILAARSVMANPLGARYALIRDLEYAAINKLGYQILSEPEAVELLDFLTRALNTNADAVPLGAQELARLKQWIDTYAQSGFDFFEQLPYMGTFSDAVLQAGEVVNPGAGFEILSDTGGIAALRQLAEDRGLVANAAERVVLAAPSSGQATVDSLAMLRTLEPPRVMDAFSAMVEARRLALALGEEALDLSEQLAYNLSRQALANADALPDWARALDRASYEVLQPLALRSDIRAFAQSNPAELAAFTRDNDALTALRRQPYESFADLLEEVAREQRRIKSAVPGFFEQTAQNAWQPKDLLFKDQVFSGNAANNPRGRVLSSTRIMKEGREVGAFERELEFYTRPDGSRSRQMVFSYANGKDAPRFLTDLDIPLVPDRGTPLATFMNVRAFNNLGIAFGDPALTRIKMSQVVNANTSVEIAWMQRMYGADNLSEYLRYTHSVRYAESALNQAGYRIANVQIEASKVGRDIASDMVNSEYFNAVEAPLDFLRRYGVNPDDVIETGHNILIDIVPL